MNTLKADHPAMHREVIRLVMTYALISALWIGLSDRLLESIYPSTSDLAQASIYKGWFFVSVSALMLYALLRRLVRKLVDSELAKQHLQNEQIQTLSLLSGIAEGSEDAIFAKDKKGKYLFFNRTASLWTGKSVNEVIGQNDLVLFPSVQADILMSTDQHIIASGQPCQKDEILDTTCGDKRICSVTKGPLYDGTGQIIGLFGIARDVTESRKAEQLLRASEERFRALFNNAAVALFIHHPLTGEILDANQMALEINGCATLSELRKNQFWLAPPYSCADALNMIHKTTLEGEQRFEWKIRGRNRIETWAEVQLNNIKLNGTDCILAIVLDITQRKMAEEALQRQTLELTQRNAELERFNRAFIGREMEMIALKKQINQFARELGHAPPHALAFDGVSQLEEKSL